ncbi:hypothetical protein RAD15_25290 [Bradyrhizobium sp. 14AA]
MTRTGSPPYAAAQVTTFRLPSSIGAQPPEAANAFSAGSGSDSFTDSRTELGLRTSTQLALPGSVVSLRGQGRAALCLVTKCIDR